MKRSQGEFTLGVDLAQAAMSVALAPEGTPAGHWRELPNTTIAWPPDSEEATQALLEWLEQVAPGGRCVRVVVESTGKLSARFAGALRGRGLPEVAIVNPARIKAFGASLGLREKTDRIDCAIIALFGAERRPQAPEPRSAAHEKLRELNRLREGYLKELGVWERRLNEAQEPAARRLIAKTIDQMQKSVKQIEKQIQETAEEDPGLAQQISALEQIKGIGPVIARTLTAELGDLRKYRRGQLVARVGVFPKRFESGSSVRRRPRLAKGGGGRLRRVLYMGATSLFKAKGPLSDYARELQRAGRPGMWIEGVLMRKLLLIARAVMCAGGFYEPKKICNAKSRAHVPV